MEMVTTRELQQKVKHSLDMAQKDHVVITRRGMPAAVLIGVEGQDWENVVYETSRTFWKMIQRRRKEKTISFDELRKTLNS